MPDRVRNLYRDAKTCARCAISSISNGKLAKAESQLTRAARLVAAARAQLKEAEERIEAHGSTDAAE